MIPSVCPAAYAALPKPTLQRLSIGWLCPLSGVIGKPMQNTPSPTPDLDAKIQADPDLVDRIFDYILAEIPQLSAAALKLKDEVRQEFAGEECYIASRPATSRQEKVASVLALFNGRNASEIARRLGIGRTTVWRYLKQSGAIKTVSPFREVEQKKR